MAGNGDTGAAAADLSDQALSARTRSHPPATPSPAPPHRQARDELEPSAPFRITAGRTQFQRPRPGAIGDLNPDDDTEPGLIATVTVSLGAPEPPCRTELPKISLTSKTATSPHGCPRRPQQDSAPESGGPCRQAVALPLRLREIEPRRTNKGDDHGYCQIVSMLDAYLPRDGDHRARHSRTAGMPGLTPSTS